MCYNTRVLLGVLLGKYFVLLQWDVRKHSSIFPASRHLSMRIYCLDPQNHLTSMRGKLKGITEMLSFQAYLCYWQNAYLELVELRASVRVFFCFSFSACQPEIAYILVVWGPLMWPHASSKPVRSGARGGWDKTPARWVLQSYIT